MPHLEQNGSKIFPLFSKLPTELLILIINKIEPIPYVRARASSSRFDSFCEENRCQIQIRFEHDATIHLVNPLTMRTFFSEKNLNGVYARINYDSISENFDLEIKMTRKNIPLLRAAISGFYFDEVLLRNTILDSPYVDAKQRSRAFEKAIDYLIEAVGNVKIRYVKECNTSAKQLDKCLQLWKPTGVELTDNGRGVITKVDKWKLPYVEKITELFGIIFCSREDTFDLRKIILNKAYITLYLKEYSEEDIYICLQKLIADWVIGSFAPVAAKMHFFISQIYHNENSTIAERLVSGSDKAIHLGSFNVVDLKTNLETWNFNRRLVHKKLDYLLCPLNDVSNDPRLGLITISHTYFGTYDVEVAIAFYCCLDYEADEEQRQEGKCVRIDAELIFCLLEAHFCNGPALDFSGWIAEIKEAEDIKKFLHEKHEFIRNFYRNN